jgi:toxin ParE1/3/4
LTVLAYTDAAERDLTEIALTIADDNPRAAHALVADVRRHCGLLERTPLMGRNRDDVGAGVRSFPHRAYIVYYRFLEHLDEVEILRIWHAARLTPRLVDLAPNRSDD